VLAAREILALYRDHPDQLRLLETQHDASDSAEWVLHPPGSSLGAALVGLPPAPGRFGLALALPLGSQRALRPAALAALVYMGVGTRQLAAGGRLTVVAAARPGRGMASTGYEFDIARQYRDHRQALAFQFILDRLQALNLIAWRRDGRRIRVVAASDAAGVLGAPAKLERDALRR
jgi:hypothetical protein